MSADKDLMETQLRLDKEMNELYAARDALTEKIKRKRSEIDTFKGLHGDVAARVRREEEYREVQERAAEAREDPEWQAWRREFLAKQRAISEALHTPARKDPS